MNVKVTYKTSNMDHKDDLEKVLNLTNEFGYNLDSNKRRIDYPDSVFEKPKYNVNKDFITGKR